MQRSRALENYKKSSGKQIIDERFRGEGKQSIEHHDFMALTVGDSAVKHLETEIQRSCVR